MPRASILRNTAAAGGAPPVPMRTPGARRYSRAPAKVASVTSTVGAAQASVTRSSLHELENRLSLNLTQADLRASEAGQRPDAAPAIGVKHRQGVEIDIGRPHVEGDDVVEGTHDTGTMRQHHPFGACSGAAGVVQGGDVRFGDLHRLRKLRRRAASTVS